MLASLGHSYMTSSSTGARSGTDIGGHVSPNISVIRQLQKILTFTLSTCCHLLHDIISRNIHCCDKQVAIDEVECRFSVTMRQHHPRHHHHNHRKRHHHHHQQQQKQKQSNIKKWIKCCSFKINNPVRNRLLSSRRLTR